MSTTFTDSVAFTGSVSFASLTLPSNAVVNASVDANAAIARTKLALDSLKPFDIPLATWKIWDSLQQLPATSSADDLGWYPGTFGTNAPLIRTSDLKNAGSTTLYCRTQIAVPPEYDSAGNFQIRIFGGMVTTVASTTGTIDVEAYEITAATHGADLCSTAAQSINSTTFANKDFVITAAGLVAGDTLDVRLTMVVNDSATATAVIGAIAKTQILCDIRG